MSKKNRKNIYICEKPIQYLNLLNIRAEKKEEINDIIIFNSFENSLNFALNLKKSKNIWNNVYYHTKRNMNVDICRNYDFIFTCHNNYFNNIIDRFGLSKRVIICEEGVGNYFITKESLMINYFLKLKRRLLILLGLICKYRFLSVFIRNLYLYYPEYIEKDLKIKNLKNKLRKFNKDFLTLIIEYQDHIYSIFNFDYSSYDLPLNKEVELFLGEWYELSDGSNYFTSLDLASKYMCNHNSFKIFKPHPHQIIELKNGSFNGIHIFQNSIPVEFLILEILKRNISLTIYHFSSTSVIYFYHYLSNKFKIVNLKPNDSYENFIKYLSKTSKENNKLVV